MTGHTPTLYCFQECLSNPKGTVDFPFRVWPNTSSCVFTIVSVFFLPSHYHYHYYRGHERRKAKEAYNIRYWSTPITTQRKNLGSGAAQFRLDSAIDRMLYQPFPWQLAEQGQSPAVYLHLSSTPCHLVLVPASSCWLKCHPWKWWALFICMVCTQCKFAVSCYVETKILNHFLFEKTWFWSRTLFGFRRPLFACVLCTSVRGFTLRWPQFAGQANMFNAVAVNLMRS